MGNAFTRSWEITKLTFGVIRKDREMLLFPLLGGIFSLLFMAAMIVPTIVPAYLSQTRSAALSDIVQYIILFVVYLGLAFIATFFNVCVVYTAKKRFEGGDATFGESFRYAVSKVHLIFSWSMLAATVGLILRLLDNLAENLGFVGEILVKILVGILGGLWSIVTIFVVPGMVYHDLGPVDAFKRSVEVLKKTWGESLIRYIGLGFVQGLAIFAGIVLFGVLAFVAAPFGPPAIVAVIVLCVLYLLVVSLVFTTATTVFNTALYAYADGGTVAEGFTQELMENAFKLKGKKS